MAATIFWMGVGIAYIALCFGEMRGLDLVNAIVGRQPLSSYPDQVAVNYLLATSTPRAAFSFYKTPVMK